MSITEHKDKSYALDDFIKENKLVEQSKILKRLKISRQSLWTWKKIGKIPPPIRFLKQNYWKVSDLEKLESDILKAAQEEIK